MLFRKGHCTLWALWTPNILICSPTQWTQRSDCCNEKAVPRLWCCCARDRVCTGASGHLHVSHLVCMFDSCRRFFCLIYWTITACITKYTGDHLVWGHSETSLLSFLFIVCSTNCSFDLTPRWIVHICGVFTACYTSAVTHQALQGKDRELQGHNVWALLTLLIFFFFFNLQIEDLGSNSRLLQSRVLWESPKWVIGRSEIVSYCLNKWKEVVLHGWIHHLMLLSRIALQLHLPLNAFPDKWKVVPDRLQFIQFAGSQCNAQSTGFTWS